MRRFGADFWNASGTNVPIEVGGYQRREQAENPQKFDMNGEPIDETTKQINWRMEFPYGS
jgi:hypothetical protein